MTNDPGFTQENLILTGYVQPNQPKIARMVAERLKMPFVDAEALLEDRIGDDTETIRKQFGGRHLQTLEDGIMQEIYLYRKSVIRISGSVLNTDDHLERVQQTGHVVCLFADLGTVLQRMHILMGAAYNDPQERGVMLGTLQADLKIQQRQHIHKIDTTTLNESQIVNAILHLWHSITVKSAS